MKGSDIFLPLNKYLTMNVDFESLQETLVAYGYKLAMAIVVLIIGFWIAGAVTRAVKKAIAKRGWDEALSSFLGSIVSIILKIAVIISVLGQLGAEMTSFVAILAAGGLAVGMALSGTLQNFAGGVMILIFKPFKVGDFIEAQGHSGVVREIQIFNTILMSGDNKKIILPNAPVSSGAMVNYSAEPTRRVDFIFGIGYNDNIDEAKATIMALIKADERIFTDPAPFIAVKELADSSVNFVVRVWSESGNYWGIYFDMQEKVKKTFDEKGIGIPYPQMDVHVSNN